MTTRSSSVSAPAPRLPRFATHLTRPARAAKSLPNGMRMFYHQQSTCVRARAHGRG